MNRKLIEKAQNLLSREKGTIFKDPGGRLTIALAYPNIYPVGMSSLGFQGIYGILNNMRDVVCERVFLPDAYDIEEYQRTGTELFSLESQKPLCSFDIIAFSVSFENDYPNVLKMMDMSGIPLRSCERDNSYPLIIMGGACTFYNPEPMADFVDICFVGEAEEMLPEFLSVCRHAETRESLYRDALCIEGVYIPRFYSVEYDAAGHIRERRAAGTAPDKVKKRTYADFPVSFLETVITTPEAEFSDMYLMEAMRGCIWSCRFCVAGRIYRPARKKELTALKARIGEVLSATGRIGLIGPSLSDYPDAGELLSQDKVDFSITSLRASRKSGRLVQMLKGHKSVSIAPEAGSERMRLVINKKITEKDILETAGIILKSGIETLRLYFMIGLPSETPEDIKEIINLVMKIRQNNRRGFLTLSISTFVPKPFTPFQWHAMASLKEVKERLRTVKKGLGHVKGVRVFHDVPKYAYIQGIFSLGDRRTGGFVEKIANGTGISSREESEARDFYIYRQKDISEILPWDFIEMGVPKEELWGDYQKALNT